MSLYKIRDILYLQFEIVTIFEWFEFYKGRNGEEKKWDEWIGRWAYENKKSGNCKLQITFVL